MSTPPAITNLQPQPKQPRGYKCPICEFENFNVMCVNTIVPLKYATGGQVGEITTLRTIAGCANCGCVLSIQFIPVDVPAAVPPPADRKLII